MSQKEISKKYKIPLNRLQKEAKKGGWAALKKQRKSYDQKSNCQGNCGLSAISVLGDRLADKFAAAVEQLGCDGGEIDTNRLRHLVAVMKDLTALKQNSENEEEKSEKNQSLLIDVIRCAVEGNITDETLAQDGFEDEKSVEKG